VKRRLARDPGSGVVLVRVQANENLEEKATVAAEIQLVE